MYALKQDYNQGEGEIWSICLAVLRQECGENAYSNWLSHIAFEEVQGDVLVLTVPSKFIREWVLNHYFTQIKQVAIAQGVGISKIDIRLRARQEVPPVAENAAEQLRENNDNNIYASSASASIASNLDKRFTFANFVAADSNRLAYNAAKMLAAGLEQDGGIINSPLLIYGMVGNGKTHLLQAIAHDVMQKYPHKKVAYLSAEKFMHQYIVSIKANNLIGFREKTRHIDCLLIDDIQFICGKASTQQEFARTINYFIESGKSVVLSCDGTPYNLQLDSRSKSRLTAGMVVAVNAPDYALRLQVLQSKSKMLGVVVDEEILEFIANNITSSVREVEAALQKIISHTRLLEIELNMQSCREILGEAVAAHKVQVSIQKIMETVATFYAIKVEHIVSKSREARYVLPRQVAAFLAKQMTDKSLQEIGYALGKRDHATIIYAVKKLEKMLQDDDKIAHQLGQITDLLNK